MKKELDDIVKLLSENVNLFQKLFDRNPKISILKKQLDKNVEVLESVNSIKDTFLSLHEKSKIMENSLESSLKEAKSMIEIFEQNAELEEDKVRDEDTLSLSEVLEQIKSTYPDSEELETIVEDLTANSYIDYWAKKLCEEEFGHNKTLAKKLFKIALKEADGDELLSIANGIADSDGYDDKQWAKIIYQEVENNVNDLEKYTGLIDSIKSYLEDIDWAKEITLKAFKVLKESDDKLEFASDVSYMVYLIEYIYDERLLHDSHKAKEVFEYAKAYEEISDILEIARAVMSVDDEEYKIEYIDNCLDRAIENVREGYYCDIYNFLKDDLEDEEKADSFKSAYYSEMENDAAEHGGCEDLFTSSVEIDGSTSGYYKLEIINAGGEYSYGFVTDEDEKDFLKNQIDSGEICLDNYSDDMNVNFYEYDDLLHVYGPNGPESKVSLTVYSDEYCENEIEEKVYNEDADSTSMKFFTSSNPYPGDYKNDTDSDALIFGGYYVEKRIHYPAVIKIDEDEVFEMENVYVGTINMDETLSSDEIVDQVLYIRPEIAEKVLEMYLGNEFDRENDTLDDHIGEIFSELYDDYNNTDIDTNIKELLEDSKCEVLNIEGKGEREEQHVVVKTLDDDVLYDGSCE